MPNEHQHMRRRVVQALRELDAIAVENSAYPGTPDVAYIGGWIELKEADNWPKKASTSLPMRHFTRHQRAWIRRHTEKGGTVFVLLKVGKSEWFLIDGKIAADILGSATRQEIQSAACLAFEQGLNNQELLKCLSIRI